MPEYAQESFVAAPRPVAPAPRTDFLPFAPPTLGEEEIAEVVDTLRSGWLSTGPKTLRFEQDFAGAIGAETGLALSSCTAGLHLALMALGIQPGDEVITTPYTFCATANVIEHMGAKTILADVQPDTLNIDPACVEAAVSGNTRAIIVVHLGGHPVDLDEIRAIAAPRGIPIVHDAAHALPAHYRGEVIGSGTELTAFSFYATKNLTTAEGGMLVGDPEMVERARVLSHHGMSRDSWQRYSRSGNWYYEVVEAGFKCNMTDIQASLGLWQLKRLPGFHRRRGEVAAAYTAAFARHPALEPPASRPYVGHGWHLYVLRLRPEALRIGRDGFLEELAGRNIGASVHFIPIHMHPYYRNRYGWAEGDFPVAADSYHRALSLPLHPGLSVQDVQDVIGTVLGIVEDNSA